MFLTQQRSPETAVSEERLFAQCEQEQFAHPLNSRPLSIVMGHNELFDPVPAAGERGRLCRHAVRRRRRAKPAGPGGSDQYAAVAGRATARMSTTIPSAYGHHRIRFYAQYQTEQLNMCVVCSNSRRIADTPGKVPTLVFLCGSGERGENGDGMFLAGPAAWMQREHALDEQCPVMVISPQCPGNHSWYEPEMTEVMVNFLAKLTADPRVDPDRVYLTGLSMGGGGTWSVAAAGVNYLAAATPICGPLTSPQTTAATLKALPLWVVCGGNDGRFTQGSRAMVEALRKVGGNVIYSEPAGLDHGIWPNVYSKMEFYQWLVSHTRGQPSQSLFSDEQLLKLASAPPDTQTNQVERDFGIFAPHWQIMNWNRQGHPGNAGQMRGYNRVFAVRPLNASTPCKMETIWTIPPDKHARLKFIAGCGLSDRDFSIKADGKEVFVQRMDAAAVADGWVDRSIDLAPGAASRAISRY